METFANVALFAITDGAAITAALISLIGILYIYQNSVSYLERTK